MLAKIRQQGGIGIAAHATGNNGILRQLTGGSNKRVA